MLLYLENISIFAKTIRCDCNPLMKLDTVTFIHLHSSLWKVKHVLNRAAVNFLSYDFFLRTFWEVDMKYIDFGNFYFVPSMFNQLLDRELYFCTCFFKDFSSVYFFLICWYSDYYYTMYAQKRKSIQSDAVTRQNFPL